jgi:hypothetical protein
MYWPLGAPRIYAAARRRRKASEDDNKRDDGELLDAKDGAAILALRISRNGQLFVTVTATTLTVWQISVRDTSY